LAAPLALGHGPLKVAPLYGEVIAVEFGSSAGLPRAKLVRGEKVLPRVVRQAAPELRISRYLERPA
jgi:hypothetical protein